jgi:Flp pilus assembly protein protease CpaA
VEVWALGAHGGLIGALDGLLFALTGFLVGFGLFFVMWVLGACGGGDVKLFAAVGAWVGSHLALCVLAGTVLVVLVVAIALVVLGLFQGRAPVQTPSRKARRGDAPQPRQRPQLLTYSLPLAIVTALVLLWMMPVRSAPGHPSPRTPGQGGSPCSLSRPCTRSRLDEAA